MLLHRYEPLDVATTSASWSGNTIKLDGTLCQQVLIESTSSNTVFDVAITDKKNRTVRQWASVTNVINDLTPWPAEGRYTVSITSATADEGFMVMLCFAG